MDHVITDKQLFYGFFFPRFALGHIPEMLLIKVKGTLRCCDFQKKNRKLKKSKTEKIEKNRKIKN